MREIVGRLAPLLSLLVCAAACDFANQAAVPERPEDSGRLLVVSSAVEAIIPGRFFDYVSQARGEVSEGPRELEAQAPAWQASQEAYPNPGLSSRTFWFRLRLESAAVQERMLYMPHSFDELRVYLFRGDVFDAAAAATGPPIRDRMLAMCEIGRGTGTLQTRRPACRLALPAGRASIYIRMRNGDSLWLPAQLLSDAAYQRRQEIENLLYGAYFGVLWIMALYNLLVYLRTRESSFLPYVAFTVANIAYFFVQSGFAAYFYYPERATLHAFIGPTTAAIFGSTACIFAASFLKLRTRSPRIYYALMAVQGILAVLWLLVVLRPSPFVALNATRMLASLGFGICLILPLIGLHSMRGGFAPARIYVAAALAFFAGGALFIARIFGWAPANWITMYAFPAGSLSQVALFSLALADRIQDLQRAVARSLGELEDAHRDIARSEERYRQLVEGSHDLIFVLDARGCVRQVNAAIQPLLGMRAQWAIDRPLAALLYSPPDSEASRGYQEALLEAQLQKLEQGGAARCSLRLANRLGQPVDVDLTLERVADADADRSLILGRAGPPERNVLVDGLVNERGVYTIGNFLSEADALYHRATVFLGRYFSEQEGEMIVFALREMIMNAIEHGNLAISFDEKTEAQEQGRYLELLLERQRRSDLRGRRVRLEYSLNARRVLYRVSDEGAGFDHRRVFREANELMGDLQISHGRGIALARQFFDRVRYNEAGNCVTLVRRTPGAAESAQRERESGV